MSYISTDYQTLDRISESSGLSHLFIQQLVNKNKISSRVVFMRKTEPEAVIEYNGEDLLKWISANKEEYNRRLVPVPDESDE